jgi:hypothetical protein
MFFFGWGSKSKTWSLAELIKINGVELPAEYKDYVQVMCKYSYFDIFFIFSIVTSKTWYLLGESRTHETKVDYKTIKSILPNATPKLGILESWGLPISFIILVIVVSISNIISPPKPKVVKADPRVTAELISINKEIEAKIAIFPKYGTKFEAAKNLIQDNTEYKTLDAEQYYTIALRVKEKAKLNADGVTKTLKYGDSKYFVDTVAQKDGKEIITDMVYSTAPTLPIK